MINIVCLVPDQKEIEYIKKRIQDTILSSDILPYRQRYVILGEKYRPMYTDNCHIDFRLPIPEKTGGLRVDIAIIIGGFNCPYSDEIANMITEKSGLGLQKKYGNSNLPVWDIVLDIEKRYAKVMEVMFND